MEVQMFKKLMFISSIIFICLISISFVCATDNLTDESILTIDDSSDAVITDSQNDDALSDGEGSFTELNQLISGATGPVNLNNDYTRLSGDDIPSSGIVIGNDITINGNGHTLDANNLGRIFYVSGSNVILKNITFVNGTEIMVEHYM